VGGSSKEQTVGYKYYLGCHMVLTHGQIDALYKIVIDSKAAWIGNVASGPLTISNYELFGGETREGGIAGVVDVLPGSMTQAKNTYLQGIIGDDIPAFRGVASVVLNQVYVGMNPYIKPWSFLVQRIHKTSNGATQWNDSISAIGSFKTRNPVKSTQSWFNRSLDWFNIGAGVETSGSYTEFQGLFTGYIDSVRVTKGVARYTSNEFAVPTSEFPNDYTDPYWDNVVTLLRFNGANNATTTTCEKGSAVYMVNGAKLSTAKFKFGTSSAVFDGIANMFVKVVVGTENTNLGDEFTIESWVYQTERESGTNYGAAILSYGPVSNTNRDTNFSIYGNSLSLFQTPGSDQSNALNISGNIEIVPLNKWTHVSLTRSGGSYYLHIDGKLCTGYSTGSDMNPAHIIRECLTDSNWGMGYPESDIDDSTFTAAANTLLSEDMGISLIWDRQSKLEDFVKEILRHIDGSLYVDRQTGKFVLKLVRDDYTISTLFVANTSNIVSVDSYSRSAYGELVNSITANYFDGQTGATASLTIQDNALIQLQGSVIGATVQYPGFSNFDTAAKAAARDLRTMSSRVLSCVIYMNRSASVLSIGSTFKFYWPDFHDDYIIMRVTGISFGDGKKNSIKVTCVEDIFVTPEVTYLSEAPIEWTDTSIPPAVPAIRSLVEAPYIELCQRIGQSTIDSSLSTNPDLGYILAAASRQGSAINCIGSVLKSGTYVDAITFDFAPSAKLTAAITKNDTSIVVKEASDLDLVTLGTSALIDAEIVRIDAISGTTITIARGLFDTVPTDHVINSAILFQDIYSESDVVEYVYGETINVKMRPVSTAGVLSIDTAIADSVTMNRRAIRPYPPGNVKISGSYFPTLVMDVALTVTWAHRSRTQQTGSTYASFVDGSIGPESGTTYSIRLYNNATNALLQTADSISGTTYSFTALSGDYVLRLELWSVRAGYASLQKHSHVFDYKNTVYLITEDSFNIVTEDANLLTTE